MKPKRVGRVRRGLREGRRRRHHRVEQRQRDGGAEPAKKRAARQRGLGDEHMSSYRLALRLAG